MRAMGFRAEKDLVHYAVVDGSPQSPTLIADDKIRLQGDCDIAEALSILRTHLLSIFATYSPNIVGVRFSDKPKGMGNLASLFARARIEGVVLEASGHASVRAIGASSPTIKSGLQTKTALRDYSTSDEVRGMDLSAIKNECRREAIIVAVSVLGRN